MLIAYNSMLNRQSILCAITSKLSERCSANVGCVQFSKLDFHIKLFFFTLLT